MASINQYLDSFTGIYGKLHQMLFSSKEISCYNSFYHQIVNESNTDGFLEAIYSEFDILYQTMKA